MGVHISARNLGIVPSSAILIGAEDLRSCPNGEVRYQIAVAVLVTGVVFITLFSSFEQRDFRSLPLLGGQP